jgi:large subunit ribosomal protein L20
MRVKRGTTVKARHKRILARAKGMRAARGGHIKAAKEALLHAGAHAYVDRRRKKRTQRALWITRLSAAVRQEGVAYSVFIANLKAHRVELDRKVLSEIAATDAPTFKQIVEQVKA